MGKAVGIDLGTTYSALAVMDESGRPAVVPNAEKGRVTPSVIYFGPDGPVVGSDAKQMQAMGNEDVAFLFKRSMGDALYVRRFNGSDYTATDLSAHVLSKLKADAEQRLGWQIDSAVITVPAYFDNLQRQATIQAGQAAGLEVLRIINEPTAAALAYGCKATAGEQSLLVYDLGGGTFDVTIVKVSAEAIQVLGTDGDHELGGRDWDEVILAFVAQRFREKHGEDPLEDPVSANDLLVCCEQAKMQLSELSRTHVAVTHAGQRELVEISRQTFEDLAEPLMQRTRRLCEEALSATGLSWGKLDGALLVGGSTRMPMVRRWVESMTGRPPHQGVNVDEAVALGAAIQAEIDSGPSKASSGSKRLASAKRIQDVMSHSLGMVAVNADRTRFINSIIIPKNRPIPCTESRPYQLRSNALGDEAEVYMLQGESSDPTAAVLLGKYVFSGIEPAAGDSAVLDISYAYDRNGVVTVSAKQRGTDRPLDLRVEALPEDLSWLSRQPDEVGGGGHACIVLSIDLSGSMYGEPIAKAQQAALGFLANIDLSRISTGLIGFATRSEVQQELCQDARLIEQGIRQWSGSRSHLGGGNEADPFDHALELFGDQDCPRFLIVLTDGRWYNCAQAIQRAEKCRDRGIEIIALGFGDADPEFLRKIATCDENAFFTDLANLSSSFLKIAQVLTESGGLASSAAERQQSGRLRFFE